MTWSIMISGHDNEPTPEDKKELEAKIMKQGHKLAKQLEGVTSAVGTTNSFGQVNLLDPDASWAEQ